MPENKKGGGAALNTLMSARSLHSYELMLQCRTCDSIFALREGFVKIC
jgi:hypothetical protein